METAQESPRNSLVALVCSVACFASLLAHADAVLLDDAGYARLVDNGGNWEVFTGTVTEDAGDACGGNNATHIRLNGHLATVRSAVFELAPGGTATLTFTCTAGDLHLQDPGASQSVWVARRQRADGVWDNETGGNVSGITADCTTRQVNLGGRGTFSTDTYDAVRIGVKQFAPADYAFVSGKLELAGAELVGGTPPAPDSVPTLSEWGVIALVLALGLVACRRVKRSTATGASA